VDTAIWFVGTGLIFVSDVIYRLVKHDFNLAWRELLIAWIMLEIGVWLLRILKSRVGVYSNHSQ